MSTLLIAYAVTGDLLDTFRRTLSVQRAFDRSLAPVLHDACIVSDVDIGALGRIPVITANCWERGEFCISRCRNAAIEYAARKNYDWLLLLDADHIVVNWPLMAPSISFPPSGFAAPAGAWAAETEPPFRDLDLASRWMQSQWFLLGRQHFNRRFCEEYVGYGLEEVDFQHVVMADVPLDHTSLRIIHLWHATRAGGQITPHNLATFTSRQALTPH